MITKQQMDRAQAKYDAQEPPMYWDEAEDNLSSCPFCGSSAIVYSLVDDGETVWHAGCMAGVDACLVAPEVDADTRAGAIESWNRMVANQMPIICDLETKK